MLKATISCPGKKYSGQGLFSCFRIPVRTNDKRKNVSAGESMKGIQDITREFTIVYTDSYVIFHIHTYT